MQRFSDCDAVNLRISEIVHGELWTGCLKSSRPERELEKVNYLLRPFELIPFGGEAVEHYAIIRTHLDARGEIIGPNDLLIAATARSLGAVLVTANEKEFARVPGLLVENWREAAR
jgi:tRNA(fMet)-specific endonuclease VapC